MLKFLKEDFNKIQNYKRKKFNSRNEKLVSNLILKSYLKKFRKTKKKRKIFSDLFFLLKRIESFSSIFPKIYKLKLLKKIKKNKKKIVKIKGHYLIKTSFNYKSSLNFINVVFVKYFYFYLNFIFRCKHKYLYFEELLKPMFKKNVLLNKKNLIFKFNYYVRWIDFSRKFIKLKKVRKLIGFSNYKTKKKKAISIKKLKFIKMSINVKSNFILYFFNFISLIISNYYKIIVFFYKKFRKKKLKI